MSKKVYELFPGAAGRNEDILYLDIFKDFIKPFEMSFPGDMKAADVFSFFINAWNLACLTTGVSAKEIDSMLLLQEFTGSDLKLVKKLIKHKQKNFASHDRIIEDFDLTEQNGEMVLSLTTVDKETYINSLIENAEDYLPDETNFEAGYIDRYAIVLKPLEPFFNWLNAIDPKNPVYEEDEVNVYLVDDDADDVEMWLKKKFDRFFRMELEDWVTDVNRWPKKRTYAMFRQWFSVDISTMVYDMENRPVNKED